MEGDEVIKMGVPCECPHCGQPILVQIKQPYPLVDILTLDELPENIQNEIVEHVNPEEPEAA